MPAAMTVATDKDGRDHCVVVVKGTFDVEQGSIVAPSDMQEPVVATDVHYGDPAITSIRYECEFSPVKPRADLIVNGTAFSPAGKPVVEVTASIEFGGSRKDIRVVGDRKWEATLRGFKASTPVPFVSMPIVFERAFGGADRSHGDPTKHGFELRNLVGLGFHRNSESSTIEGKALPNLEDPRSPIGKWSDTPAPVGFGVISRGWRPRVDYAGTYDERWLSERFPFLPSDFDPRYFQSAPTDQQVPFFRGGESVRCLNMSPRGPFEAVVPSFDVPIVFRFKDGDVPATPNLDTLIVEPTGGRILAIWRASARLGPKLKALREVVVGPQSRPQAVTPSSEKRRFRSLGELVDWSRSHDRSSPRKSTP
jgi:hypothetical protein